MTQSSAMQPSAKTKSTVLLRINRSTMSEINLPSNRFLKKKAFKQDFQKVEAGGRFDH